MNLGKLLSNFAKHYKPGRGGFSLNKPVNSNGVTEQSYAGVQVPMQNPAASPLIKNADPQTMYRTRMNAVEGNPLNFIGDMGTKLGGGENGRVEISGGHEQMHDLSQKGMDESKRKLFDVAIRSAMSGEPQTAPGDYRPTLANDFMMGVDDPIRVGDGLDAGVKPKSKLGEKLSKTKSEINRREGKDFSKKVNPETGEITYGADYDKDHDWKDSLRSAGLGILQSLAQANPNESLGTMLGRGLGGGIAGGVGGALDRNADEKLGNKIALGNLYQDYAKQLGVQDAELGISKKQKDLEAQDSIIRDRETDNQRQQSELERKIAKDEATSKYWASKIDQGKIRLAQNEELIAIRDRLAQSKDKNDARRLDLVEKEMENRNMRAEADRESRERIAGQRLAQSEQRLGQAVINRKDRLQQWAKQNNMSRARFKTSLDAQVSAGKITQEQANAALADFDN